MTINGAITELQLLLKASDMPTYYKPCIKKIIETIQMELVYQMSRLDEIEHRIEMHEKAMAKVVDTPQNYLVKTPQESRDSHEIAKNEPNRSEKPNNSKVSEIPTGSERSE